MLFSTLHKKIYFLFIFLILLVPERLGAETIRNLPPRSLPEPEKIPPSQIPIQIPLPQEPNPVPDIPDIPGNITVKQFDFIGSTVFTPEQLNQAIAEYIGKPITFTQLLQVANRITELYFKEGYITSGAYIPNQELDGDVVKIQIVEGTLEDININITKSRLQPNYVRDRIKAHLPTPLNIKNLQKALQLLQLDPLIEKIDADLSAGTRPGSNILDVTVVGAKTFRIVPQINNNRNPAVGTFERGVEIGEDNLIGIGDEISFAYNNTDGSNQYEVFYTLPINAYNGTISFYYRKTDNTIIEEPFNQLDFQIDYQDYIFTYRQPVLMNADSEGNQELALGFSVIRRESNSFLGGDPFPLSDGANNQGEIRISALAFSQEWLARSREDVIAARSEFDIGLDAFNATVNNDGADSQYFLWRGQFAYLRLLSPPVGYPAVGTTLLLRSDIQLTTSPLLPLEQFSLGGDSTVRGYRQDSIVTDNGFYLSAEVRIPILRVPEVAGNLQIAPFIDFGTGWNLDRSDNSNQTSELTNFDSTILGMGFGLLWLMGDNFTARFDFGFPLISIDNQGDGSWQQNGIYFQVDYKFRPF